MAHYRRADVPGGTFFFTLVTYERRPLLTTDLARRVLRDAIEQVRSRRPFEINGFVLLPDHLHTIWTLPSGDTDYPTRWRQIKTLFTRGWLAGGGTERAVSVAQAVQGGRGIWQRRYYERTVRDEAELRKRLDYIHINPVKHRLCERAIDWPWSSFHRYVKLGEYEETWGGSPEFYGDEWIDCE
ncbi:REP-associated tyrosine transposase [Aeoliella sp. SH292]|uniref:REP-associated tyrosine transposase n=1 Tax=Aeoliella sp. SH292 TaxID=3454464 RepID=UPI003F9BE96D